ncbi:MAG: ABC transporter substrate-binding protein [Gammaproteobacteria bacterium]|nr:MAG: ABC transporter substrate-binding protein [Gammaproteobacteria bacterium]
MCYRFLFLLASACLWLVPGISQAADTVVTIAYLELDDDPRYREKQMQARYPAQPWGRPYAGAEVALKESRFAGAAMGVEFRLSHHSEADVQAAGATIERLAEEGVKYFLLDLPGDAVAEIARRTRGRELLLFNLSALDDALRKKECQAHLLHLAPSHAMLADTLAQYLVSRKWKEVLVLQGPNPEDAQLLAAFERSAKRFGLKIEEIKPFVLGRNPRERSANNVALLTSGADYDVVFVADANGEFARDVPYQIQKPRPVVGSAGLVPDWWNWAWERHGAPQLNGRFLKRAKRLMTGYDWSAWVGVKAVVESVVRTQGSDFQKVRAYMLSDELILDGFKGNRLSFRPWDHQLRQPLFLTTQNWVVARAPLEGFLHQTNNLDTLGFDKPDSACRF